MTASVRLPVVLLWHMHQPHYRDALTGQYVLPWTYLHAIKDYTDMAAHLEARPGARAVVNFTPVLLEQLEDITRRLAAHLEHEQRAVADAVGGAADDESVVHAAGVATAGERQAGVDARTVDGAGQRAPPRLVVIAGGHSEDAGSVALLGERAQHFIRRAIGRHRHLAAVMVARQVPDTGIVVGRRDRDGEFGLRHDRRAHELAPKPHQNADRQIAGVASAEAAQDLGLAQRHLDAGVFFLLGGADFGDQVGAAHQQVVQLVVDLVDLPTQGFERARWLGHGGLRCNAGVFDNSKAGAKAKKTLTYRVRVT